MRDMPWGWMGSSALYAALIVLGVTAAPWPGWVAAVVAGGWTAGAVVITARMTRRAVTREWADQARRLQWRNDRLWGILEARARRPRRPS